MDVLMRIVSSKKVALAAVTLLGDIGLVWGFDVPVEQLTQGVGAVWNGLGALLITSQSLLDLKWGSPSDGTGQSGQ